MADAAPGAENAIRGVVIVTDGEANTGGVRMHDIVKMESRRNSRSNNCNEMPVFQCDVRRRQYDLVIADTGGHCPSGMCSAPI